jgi:hypothetical protein
VDIETADEVQQLVEGRIPEGPALEYKADLLLGSKTQRIEALKDLTGMGNGGGGTIVFGVSEGEPSVPQEIHPLADPGLVGRLEDVVRSSVRPPLLAEYRPIAFPGGLVLVVAVQRSPLGPYMVEAYQQHRYFIRHGTRTDPMSEQEVRDAHLIGARGREGRAGVWDQHHLPLRPEREGPWLSLSGIPMDPLVDLLDDERALSELALPDHLRLHADLSEFHDAFGMLRLWADGVHGVVQYQADQPPIALFRLHRNGAFGIGKGLSEKISLLSVPRVANAQLLTASWVWRTIGVRTPLEVDLRVSNLGGATTDVSQFREERTVIRPPGVLVEWMGIRHEVLLSQLEDAAARHALVAEFTSRLSNVFGLRRSPTMFERGWLYGRDGKPLGLSLVGRLIADSQGRSKGLVYEGGLVENAVRNELVAGYVSGGAVLDEHGRTMAVLEFGLGSGVPRDFVQRQTYPDPRPRVNGDPGEPGPNRRLFTAPDSVREWSQYSLMERLSPDFKGIESNT